MLRMLCCAALLMLAGCGDDTPLECDCDPSQHCVAGRCVTTAADAGPNDAGPDGSTRDSGHPDSGPGDSGPGDSGPGDSGPGDSGPPDAGPPDAGPGDAGPCPSSTLCGASCVDTQTNTSHCGGCSRACGDREVCSGGACHCGSGPPCTSETYCMAGACHPLPTIVQEPACGDLGVAHPSPGFLVRYTIYGRPGARVHKWNLHRSCSGAVASESPETSTSSLHIEAGGSVTFSIPSPTPIRDCAHQFLGTYEVWAIVDGHESPHVMTTGYNSLCPGINTCRQAATFCPL